MVRINSSVAVAALSSAAVAAPAMSAASSAMGMPSGIASTALSAMPTMLNNNPGMSAGSAAGSGGRQSSKTVFAGTAIYFLTNDEQHNAVVALPIMPDGKLKNGTTTWTQGKGATAISAMTGKKVDNDDLISQGALTLAGGNIFAVNAGSNTLSMMKISANDPTKLTMVGKAAELPGEFPVTVAASTKHSLVCVGMTGKKSGISCTNWSAQGLGKMDALRSFDLNQSTPPKGPPNTVSHTFFAADQNSLITTVKGDPMKNNTGFMSVFSVEKPTEMNGQLSTKDMRSKPMGTAVMFGSGTIARTKNLFVTDAAFGAAIISLDDQGKATTVANQTIKGQKATCWAAVSDYTRSAFVTDVGVNRVTEMSLDDASILGQVDLSSNGDPGLIDLRAAGNFVYALSPGNATIKGAVTVLDISGGQGTLKQLQHFSLDGIAGPSAQGMAIM